MFSPAWRIISLLLFLSILLVLGAIYVFAPAVWETLWQYSPGSPFVQPP